jgi:anti-sigma factor RsiW
MMCSLELVNAYLDAELDNTCHAEMVDHLAGCKACAAMCAQLRDQQIEIRSIAPYYEAPVQLRESVRFALRQRGVGPANEHIWRRIGIAASVLLAASLAWNVHGLLIPKPGEDLLARALVADHVRSLIGTHLLDVVSSDQHTVKPWFNGKLDFAPEVKDCAAEGFPLIGGRIEYVSDRSVAALIYNRRQHVINLFMWPSSPSDARSSRFVRNGFNVREWSDATLTYWAVSDLDDAELQKFRDLYSQ